MKSVDELNALRNKALETIKLRREAETARIIIGTGTAGISAGAREITKLTLEALSAEGLADVKVIQDAELTEPGQEPVLQVVKPGVNKVTYGKVTPDKVKDIVVKHIKGCEVIKAWLLA